MTNFFTNRFLFRYRAFFRLLYSMVSQHFFHNMNWNAVV